MADDSARKDTPRQKPRVKKAVPYDAKAVAATIAAAVERNRPPLYKRAVFIVPALAVAVVAIPFLQAAVNLLRPDISPPTPLVSDHASARPLADKLEKFARDFATLRKAHPEFTDAICGGEHHDAALTPAFLAALNTLRPVSLDGAEAATPLPTTEATAALTLLDGIELARLTECRAQPIDTPTASAMRAAHAMRLRLARCRLASANSPERLDAALNHTLAVLEEITLDRVRLLPGLPTDNALLRELALESEPPAAAAGIAAGFDIALDAAPDTALRLMTEADAATPLADTTFGKLLRFGRRKNAHREKVSDLHGCFGRALAAATFRDAYAALTPPRHNTETRRLASMVLRESVLRQLGTDHAIDFFYNALPVAPRDFDRFLLEFAAVSKGDDTCGEALLLYRRARLLKLVARQHRVRFEAAATAYGIAVEHRRSLDGGRWPKSTEGLFDGLLDTYPADPFTGEPLAYARKRKQLTSPGADLTPIGGLAEPEFATDLMQLWEPTHALEPDAGPAPESFGLRAADLEKPVPRPWELPQQHPPRQPAVAPPDDGEPVETAAQVNNA